MIRLYAFVTLVIIGVAAMQCGGPDSSAVSLQYEVQHVEDSFGDCGPDSGRCAVIKMTYPLVTSSASSATTGALNDAVQRFIQKLPTDTGQAESVSAVVEDFGLQYSDLVADFPEYPSGWTLERTVTVPTDTLDVIGLKFEEFSYTGGAHPMYTVEFANFDAADGRQLALADVVDPDAMENLQVISERQLRRQRNLPDSVSLAEAGFWFGDSTFQLTENFLVDRTGLLLYYNPYEIAPYAMGPISITIPYRELAPLVPDSSPIRPFVTQPIAPQ